MSFRVPARVLMDDAALILQRGAVAISAGEREIDMAYVEASDSSLIACLLAWRRIVLPTGEALIVLHPSDRVRGLAKLYGVEQIVLD